MLILKSNFSFKRPVEDDSLQLKLIDENDFTLLNNYEVIRKEQITKICENIIDYSVKTKNPFKGEIILRNSEENTFLCLKLNKKGINEEQCDVNITIKNAGKREKTKTFNEKMEILKKYVVKHKKFPEDNVVIENVKLGQFVKKLFTDEEHVNEFNSIKEIIKK